MIQFKKYKRVPGNFEPSDTQHLAEPTEFTTEPAVCAGTYWVSSRMDPCSFQLVHLSTGLHGGRFAFRSVVSIPKPPTHVKILEELQELVVASILCGGGDHEKVALNIGWGDVPKNLREYLICENDTVYLPT